MNIVCITDKRFAVNSYCILSDNHAVIIDPIMTSNLEQVLSKYIIDFSILTHEHYDHIYSVNELKNEYGFPILCGTNAKDGLTNPAVNLSRYVEFLKQYIPFEIGQADSSDYTCQANRFLKDGEIIEWQEHKLFIKETPGHSKGSICILLDDKYLFSGDTIFREFPTATRMPGGSTRAYKTITEPWLDSLPQEIVVYPGHTDSFGLSERYKTSC